MLKDRYAEVTSIASVKYHIALTTFRASYALPSQPVDFLPANPNWNSSCASTPSSFFISNFYTFTPAPTKPQPASIYFDLMTSTQVPCTTSKLVATTSVTDSPGYFTANCGGGIIGFTYSATENVVVIVEDYQSCSTHNKTRIMRTVYIGKFCNPTEPPLPQGAGSQCQIHGNTVSGSFDPDTINNYGK